MFVSVRSTKGCPPASLDSSPGFSSNPHCWTRTGDNTTLSLEETVLRTLGSFPSRNIYSHKNDVAPLRIGRNCTRNGCKAIWVDDCLFCFHEVGQTSLQLQMNVCRRKPRKNKLWSRQMFSYRTNPQTKLQVKGLFMHRRHEHVSYAAVVCFSWLLLGNGKGAASLADSCLLLRATSKV